MTTTPPPKREKCHAENPKTRRLCALDKGHSKKHYDGSSFHWDDVDPSILENATPRAQAQKAKPKKPAPAKKPAAPKKSPPKSPTATSSRETDKWGQKVAAQLVSTGHCAATFKADSFPARQCVCTLAAGHEGPHENTSVGIKENAYTASVRDAVEDSRPAAQKCFCGGPVGKSKPHGLGDPMVCRIPNHEMCMCKGGPAKTHMGGVEGCEQPKPDALVVEADAPEAEEAKVEVVLSFDPHGNITSSEGKETFALVPREEVPQMLSVERARDLLKNSKNVDEVRDVHDKAVAVATYLRAVNASIESQNDAAEIRLRAERRLGELSKELAKAPAGRPAKKAAKSAAITKSAQLAELGLKERDARRFEQIAEIPEKKFDDLVEETKAKGARLTASAPLKMVRQEAKAQKAADLRAKPVPQPDGSFDVIVIDPPWFYEKRAEDITQRGQIPYPPMTQEELLALPVPDRSEKNCVLWIWTTNAFLEDAIALGKHWGFTRKTMLTWGKGRFDEKSGEFVDHMGNGDNLRGQTEHCLMFVKGKPTLTLKGETTLLLAPAREHSRKPDEFYALVDSLCPGTKLDMFAQEEREGFVVWGSDTAKFSTEAA